MKSRRSQQSQTCQNSSGLDRLRRLKKKKKQLPNSTSALCYSRPCEIAERSRPDRGAANGPRSLANSEAPPKRASLSVSLLQPGRKGEDVPSHPSRVTKLCMKGGVTKKTKKVRGREADPGEELELSRRVSAPPASPCEIFSCSTH